MIVNIFWKLWHCGTYPLNFIHHPNNSGLAGLKTLGQVNSGQVKKNWMVPEKSNKIPTVNSVESNERF